MGILKQLEQTILNIEAEDYEQALISVMIAIDATAKNEYPRVKQTGERFKRFLSENMDVITYAAYGNFIHKLKLPNVFKSILESEKLTQKEYLELDEIFYHIVRCNLFHEAEIPISIGFTDEPIIDCQISRIILSKFLVWGMLLIVISAKSNRRLHFTRDYTMSICNKTIVLNQIWGNRELLLKIIH